ncbi:MAG: transcription elongation factor GreA [Deltaproteobacteria bacterium]|nr:MAG: transcription elongation factor GreA [Deltaproteobacteria bacterium]
MSQTVPMTPEGHLSLQEELKHLIRVERPKVIQDIAEARAHGDLSENAEYDAAKNRQGFVEGRISEINGKMALSQVIDISGIDTDKVIFGATVKMFDVESEVESTYRIVGQDEANIKQGLISINSPVARALIGHRVDDEVSIKVPSGTRIYEIIDIQYV